MVTVETNKGSFSLELFADVAPQHVDNFRRLVEDGFYEGLHFHRLEPNFVIQVGCPHTRQDARDPRAGTGGPGWTVPAEFSERPHLRGTLGMARSSHPDSAGSQFYICLADARFLDGQYTVFGEVTGDGMDVVDKLEVGDVIEKVSITDD
ncbi:MAG: peptidylprolyl isomerase [Armatimonadetes bacterium]|nr:peptidylprolyl isomerase [Armatimonadota bacterium]